MFALAAQILVPVTVFTAIVLCLTVIVMFARQCLEPSGTVQLTINSTRLFEIRAGERLLSALAANGVYLPAACGGRGACGQCRVMVTSGAGPILPSEEPHISASEAAAGVRLACLFRVTDPVAVSVADEVLAARQVGAVVESNQSLTTYLKALVLRPDTTLDFEAGDYLLIEAPPYEMDFSVIEIDPRFRPAWVENGFFALKAKTRTTSIRAYSIANPPSVPDRIELLIRIALPPPAAPRGTPPGCVSSYLYGLRQGERIGIRGPYGDFHVRDTEREMVFIGGGAGIAPIRSMILDQLGKRTVRRMSLWYGARDINDICYRDDFQKADAEFANFSYHIALSSVQESSSWSGFTGFVHAVAYEHYLRDHPEPKAIEFYLCGPPLMSAATLGMLERLGVPRTNIFYDDFGEA